MNTRCYSCRIRPRQAVRVPNPDILTLKVGLVSLLIRCPSAFCCCVNVLLHQKLYALFKQVNGGDCSTKR